jgi:hypothetical protein
MFNYTGNILTFKMIGFKVDPLNIAQTLTEYTECPTKRLKNFGRLLIGLFCVKNCVSLWSKITNFS